MNTLDKAMPNSERKPLEPEEYVKGIKVEKSIIVNRPLPEVYKFWRDFSNLPKFMKHLKSVVVMDAKHSHWTMYAPARTTVEWDAEIIEQRNNEFISWRS